MAAQHGSHRPRTARRRHFDLARVWVATAVMLLGVAVAGLGVVLLSWPVAVAGATVVLVAGAQAVQAGIMQDVRVKGGRGLEGAEDNGPGGHPGDTSISPQAAEAGRRPLATESDLARLAAWLILLAGAWLTLAPYFLPYPFTSSGQDHIGRDRLLGLSLVLLAVPLARTPRIRPVVSAAAALLALVLGGMALGTSGAAVVRADEAAVAATVLVAVAARFAVLSRETGQ